MKKFFTLWGILFCTSMLLAYDFEVGGIYYEYNYNYYDGNGNYGVNVTDDGNCNGYSGNLTIPSNVTHEGTNYTVVGLSSNVFCGGYNITSLYIPSTIQYIGDEYNNPFSNLDGYNLSSITISPENSVLVADGKAIYSKDMKILYWLYYNDYYNSEYRIAPSVEEIKSSALHGQANTVTLPNTVKKIGDYAFNNFGTNTIKYEGSIDQYFQIEFGYAPLGYDIHKLYIQDALLTSVSIPSNVTKIQEHFFYNLDSLKSITIPSSVVSIGREAFANTAYYKDDANWENGVLYIDDCLIKAKDTCTNVVVKEGTRLIADYAFSKGWSANTTLQSVVLPNSLQIIGEYAFQYCQNLTNINFPNSLTYLADNAFSNSGINFNDDSMYDEDGVLYLGPILVKAKTSLTGEYHIKNGTTIIMGSAFNNCNNLISVTIPNSVTSIGRSAFSGCRSLTSVTIPNSVNSIGNGAFAYCYGLTSVIWNVKHYNDFSSEYNGRPFYESYRIKNFVFGDDVEYIPAYLCYNMDIDEISIPDNVIAIGNSAFRSCDNLSRVTIGKSVKSFGSNVFDGCKITDVIWNAIHADDLSTRTENYSEYNPLFYQGSSYEKYNQITNITFGKEVEHIPANLCYRLDKLTSISIPNSVKSIGGDAFYNCNGLKVVNISNIAAWCSIDFSSVSGEYYYEYDCPPSNPLCYAPNLYLNGVVVTDIVLSNGVSCIKDYAFPQNKGIQTISVPSSITSIGKCNYIPYYFIEGNTPASIQDHSFNSNVYLIVNDTTPYKTAWPNYKDRIFLRDIAVQTIEVTANSSISSIHKKIGEANLTSVIDLTVKGSINSYDLMIMRNKMVNLRFLDISEASIEANTYKYYSDLYSHTDSLLDHSFANLLSLKLPKTLKYVENAVRDCPNLSYLEINNGKIAGEMVPSNNLNVVLNEGVTSISSTAFAGKKGLKSITIPTSLGVVDNNTFKSCTGLCSVSIADGLTSIGNNAFKDCNTLQTIKLGEGITTIGNNAFQNTALTSVLIPSSVTSIGDYAFAPNAINNYYYDNSGSLRNTYSSYYDTYYSKLEDIQFSENSQLKSIGNYAFYGCLIDSLVLPDSVNSIGNYAYAHSKNLEYVYLPDNPAFKSISAGAFQNCGAINSLHLPEAVETIGELSFSVNQGERYGTLDLVLPERVSKISRGAFYDRGSNLKHVAFPSSLKSIELQAFASCSALDSISFPTSLQTIGDKAFQGCSGLKELRVPSTLLSVGNYAFDGCNNIKKVYTYTLEPVSIDQQTFSCWHSADLYVPTTSYYTYYYNTQWSQFLTLKEFDEEYTYFYINNDYELDNSTGAIDGKPDADLNPGSGLIISGDSVQQAGTITVNDNSTSGAASILACEETLQADTLVIRLGTQKGKWSFFCFPFDILFNQIEFGYQYVFREYDGLIRAQYGSGGWKNVVGGLLEKGLGYIFQGAQTDTLVITVPNPRFDCHDFSKAIRSYASTSSVDANWNFIGNPYPSWYDLDALLDAGFSSPVYTWNGTDYDVYTPGDDEYHFHPYEGFFIQSPHAQDATMIWGNDGRETKTQADDKRNQGRHYVVRRMQVSSRAAARMERQAAAQRLLINLTLSSDEYTDRTRIVFNESANADYEPGKDAVKMDGGTAPLHIWSQADDVRYAVNERPFGNQYVALGYDVNADGYYTLAATRMDTAVIIYDNVLQQEVDLSQGEYVFYTDAGTNTTRFSIIRIKEAAEVVTDLNGTQMSNETSAGDPLVSVYTVLGVKLYNNVRLSDVKLTTGIYVIESADGTTKQLTVDK